MATDILQLHSGQPVLTTGDDPSRAQAAMVLLHGRGATAESILGLARELDVPGFVYVAPQAAGHTWYPHSFLAPIEKNEPWLSSALDVVTGTLDSLDRAGITPERTIILGFSQGACLALEYGARHAQRYGGVAGLSGGLIGPEGTSRRYEGDLSRTPVFLGCSDADAHIPAHRVRESAAVLEGLGAQVTMRLYENMGHTINADEIRIVRAIMEQITGQRS